jgi:hypothetical protein
MHEKPVPTEPRTPAEAPAPAAPARPRRLRLVAGTAPAMRPLAPEELRRVVAALPTS